MDPLREDSNNIPFRQVGGKSSSENIGRVFVLIMPRRATQTQVKLLLVYSIDFLDHTVDELNEKLFVN